MEHVPAGGAVGLHVGDEPVQPAELEHGLVRRAGVHCGCGRRVDVLSRGEEGQEGGGHPGEGGGGFDGYRDGGEGEEG